MTRGSATDDGPLLHTGWVAAVYGCDLDLAGGPLDGAGLIAEGYELLALDRPAVSLLLHRGLPFRTVEDWLGIAGPQEPDPASAAGRAANGWDEHHPDALTTDGVHWPLLDHLQQATVWLALTVALRLAGVVRTSGVTRFRFVRGHASSPLEPTAAPLEAVTTLWSRLLPDAADPYDLPAPGWRTRLRVRISRSRLGGPLRTTRAWADERRFTRAAENLLDGRDCVGASDILVLLLLPGRELLRSAPILDRVADTAGTALVVVPWMNTPALTEQAGRLSGRPWLPTPRLEIGRRDDERLLREGVRQNLAAHDLGELEVIRTEVGIALDGLARGWAAQSRRLRWAQHMLLRLSPSMVVTTRLDVAYEIATEAARIAGVPTLTMPHGVQEWSPQGRLARRPGVAHVAGIHNPTAPADTYRVCRDALIRYEYPHRVERVVLDVLDAPDAPESPEARTLTVLAISEGFGVEHVPSIGIRTHEHALLTLARAAERAGPRVRVLLKPHPGTPDEEHLLLASNGDFIRTLPREADLFEAIAMSDLVIGVNAIGSALVHAVASGAAVVRLSTHPLYRADGAIWQESRDWAAFWDEVTLSTDDEDALARLLIRASTDHALLVTLRGRSHSAADRLLAGDGAERVTDVIEGLLTDRADTRSQS